MHLTAHHAKYYAHDLTRLAPDGMARLSMALFDAAVDLNPHQIEAALFVLESPLSKGALLADEVGLGKTIEAGIVLCQFWAERKRRLLVVCPASLRRQWSQELAEKFNLPSLILDAKMWRELQRKGRDPLSEKAVVIVSLHLAHALREELRAKSWDLAVIDEAHKLRGAYKSGNKVGQGIRWALEDVRKLLLTATPLQNSLMELYGLSSLIDAQLFGDEQTFRARYLGMNASLEDLRQRLASFCRRTLRNQVSEYVRYTERLPMTQPFSPTLAEQRLYEAVSSFLQREDSYALPVRQRHLTTLVLRKLLASSSHAIAATLETLLRRLEALRDAQPMPDAQLTLDAQWATDLLGDEALDEELLDEFLGENEEKQPEVGVDPLLIALEIAELQQLSEQARAIGTDTKSRSLLTALEIGFQRMAAMGAAQKALVFTESRRTQDYLLSWLEDHGYRDQVVLFNGTNSDVRARQIYDKWLTRAQAEGRVTGSRAVDQRTALLEHFRDHAQILLATEAGAEGINLQFCALVVNYDLPWNPQRIEQRIGRCHRYGQEHDVVVVNFLNENNEADKRVLELLGEKFRLFSGIFGASDEVLGTIESGLDFEQRILAIYQQCRTPAQIDAAFAALQAELDAQIHARMEETRRKLLEHFDEDVHQRLRVRLHDAQAQLDRFGQRFWRLTQHQLAEHADFNETLLVFDLHAPPKPLIQQGRYHLISKTRPESRLAAPEVTPQMDGQFLYRLSHPLGEHVVQTAKLAPTPLAHVHFDSRGHPTRIVATESLRDQSGFLTLLHLHIDAADGEDHLLLSGFTDDGTSLDHETMEKLFLLAGHTTPLAKLPESVEARLRAEGERHVLATIHRALDRGSRHFQEARERLERWAEDLILLVEKELTATKEQLKLLRRQARGAVTLEEQAEFQTRTQALERQQRRQRQEVFDREDEIAIRRDALIAQLEKRLSQTTSVETLFSIRWSVL